jgi:hypothetical protein
MLVAAKAGERAVVVVVVVVVDVEEEEEEVKGGWFTNSRFCYRME